MDLFVVLEMGPESGHEKGDAGRNHTEIKMGSSFEESWPESWYLSATSS